VAGKPRTWGSVCEHESEKLAKTIPLREWGMNLSKLSPDLQEFLHCPGSRLWGEEIELRKYRPMNEIHIGLFEGPPGGLVVLTILQPCLNGASSMRQKKIESGIRDRCSPKESPRLGVSAVRVRN
jgi:hypothetical protein